MALDLLGTKYFELPRKFAIYWDFFAIFYAGKNLMLGKI